jgi:hypothetical protein
MPSFGRSEDFDHKLDVSFDKLSEEEQLAWRAELVTTLIGEGTLEALEALR